MNKKKLKQRLQNGECLFGPFIRTTEPPVTEIFGYAGFDFAILDMEHGPMSVHQAETLVRAAWLSGLAPVIRVRENAETMIVRALDTAAQGVQIPQVNSAAAAREAVACAKFYPAGRRGVCRFTRNAEYGNVPPAEYFSKANEETLVVLQIEGMEGVRQLDAILDVPGIDVLFLGPYDLSQSMGVPGQVTHPEVLKVIEQTTRKARDKGLAVGSFADGMDTLQRHREMGIQYLSCCIDTQLLYEAARERLERLHNG